MNRSQYAWRAVDPSGQIVRGRLGAVNPLDLDMKLSKMGLDLVSEKRCSPTLAGWIGVGKEATRRELIHFCFHLEQLLHSGVSLMEALTDLRDSLNTPAQGRLQEVIDHLMESIKGGKTLSLAMIEHPKVFDDVFVSLIRVGEISGHLPRVLKNRIESLKWQDELAAHTGKLLMYPTFLAVTVIAVLSFAMGVLVPKMAVFIENLGQEIPFQTRLLLTVSEVFVNYGLWMLGGGLLLVILLITLIRTHRAARVRFDSFLLGLPWMGPVIHKIILARFSESFAMMVGSGIPILEAIQMAKGITGNKVVEDALHRAGQMIAEGSTVSLAFQDAQLFPPLVVRMLRVGENTGSMEVALANVGYFYHRDVRESVERVQAIIEPLLIVILGLVLGWIMLAVFGPIYDSIAMLTL
ncbi:MAG: type II secretion system F family protein [Rhodocyclaceae bacterium]|nr:type II secretion system F family protein [Rhodocyclaceae bacterium]